MKPLYLSVDLGGTSLRMALLDGRANFLAQQRLSSDLVRRAPELLSVLSRETRVLQAEAAHQNGVIQGLALGIPGLVDSEHGVVRESPHFPEWRDVAIRQALEGQFPFPIFMDNDANQAALGEAWKGAGRSWPDFILMTLGTGIGGGIVQGGKIFRGPNGFAGEIGHIVIERRGLVGALGSRGTLETFASQSGLCQQLEHLQKTKDEKLNAELRRLDPKDPKIPEALAALAAGGNATATALWRDFGEALGCGIASLAHAFGFTRFVIGGGLAAAWEHFIPACREEIRARMYATTAAQLELAKAELGNEAGLIGGVRAMTMAP